MAMSLSGAQWFPTEDGNINKYVLYYYNIPLLFMQRIKYADWCSDYTRVLRKFYGHNNFFVSTSPLPKRYCK